MEKRDRKSAQGGQEQLSTPGQPGRSQNPGQGGSQQGGGDGSQRGSDKPAARPTPSGVPNEGRKTEGQGGGQDARGPQNEGDYKYKGGRQSTGGIPNPDDQDDGDSAGSFRGTADDDAHASDADDEDRDQAADSGRNRAISGFFGADRGWKGCNADRCRLSSASGVEDLPPYGPFGHVGR